MWHINIKQIATMIIQQCIAKDTIVKQTASSIYSMERK